MPTGSNYDLKVGFSCNNHCIHCVIGPNRDRLQKKHLPIDSTYAEILDCIRSPEFQQAQNVVITGGEPTLRKEFMRILRYIQSYNPQKRIILQTNGRKLAQYLDEIYQNRFNIYFVVAIHASDEALHNRIVANSQAGVSPFQETLRSLLKIKALYRSFASVARIEIVLSALNYRVLPQTIEDLMKMGFDAIGVSYPHMDGIYAYQGKDYVGKISLSYAQFRTVLPQVYHLAQEYPDLKLIFEEIPSCMWRDEQGNLFPLLKNIQNMSNPLARKTVVKYPQSTLDINFSKEWANSHRQVDTCQKCILQKNCLGVWREAAETFGNLGFSPVQAETDVSYCCQEK